MKQLGQKKIKRVNQIMAVVVAVIIFVSAGLSFAHLRKIEPYEYENKIRLLTAELCSLLEQGEYPKWEYPYMVCDLKGTVLYADQEFDVCVGETICLKEELQMDQFFKKSNTDMVKRSRILEYEKEVTGFAIFMFPKELIMGKEYYKQFIEGGIPFCIGVILCILILLGRIWYMDRRVLEPIGEISKSAQHIIRGNYEYEFTRVFSREVNEDEVGQLVYSFELMRDELKEKQIREEELKSAQQEMISCISHDLKTPISTIKAYAEGVRDGIATTEEARQEYIRIIIKKTNLLIGMIEELLKFSNAQLNQLEIYKKEQYFVSFFEQAMNEIEGYVRQNHMEFSYQICLEEQLVNMDEKRILEVLYNLVDNSLKYRREKGEIEIIAMRQGEDVLVRVLDSGIGISNEDLPHIFDKFYRAEKSRSSSIPGSGLGLSICKYIVENHGGSIYCKNRQGHGCEIGFTIGLDS